MVIFLTFLLFEKLANFYWLLQSSLNRLLCLCLQKVYCKMLTMPLIIIKYLIMYRYVFLCAKKQQRPEEMKEGSLILQLQWGKAFICLRCKFCKQLHSWAELSENWKTWGTIPPLPGKGGGHGPPGGSRPSHSADNTCVQLCFQRGSGRIQHC